jgi:hypothetical protein
MRTVRDVVLALISAVVIGAFIYAVTWAFAHALVHLLNGIHTTHPQVVLGRHGRE